MVTFIFDLDRGGGTKEIFINGESHEFVISADVVEKSSPNPTLNTEGTPSHDLARRGNL